MKRILALFSLIGLLAASGQVFAVGYNVYSALIYVYDYEGNPLSGIPVSLFVKTWYGMENEYTCLEFGTTGSNGSAYLECWIPTQYSTGLDFMSASMTDQSYDILSSQNTYSQTASQIYPVFYIGTDDDGDLLDDNLELQIAQKFSPVLHRHSFDNQPDLANFDQILENNTRMKYINLIGQTDYDEDVPPIHAWQDWLYDSFGEGTQDGPSWKLDFDNSIRNVGAPVGQRPVYWHVYYQDGYYYCQYWYYFTFNDLTNSTSHQTWHEGDWEHVSLKIQKNGSNYEPTAINFYQHEGGRTYTPQESWWSSTNIVGVAPTQGYSENRTHLHIWIAANSHASYNRYDKVYDFTLDANLGIGDDHVRDNVDYDPTGYNLYFEYDYLEKMGEIKYETGATRHGFNYLRHTDPLKNSKEWLAFFGRMGEFWSNAVTATRSPFSPAHVDRGDNDYYSFIIDYGVFGFGNLQSTGDSFWTNGIIQWKPDLPDGD